MDILQQDFASLSDCKNDWLMEFNPYKCFVLNISMRREPLYNYTLKGTVLQSVDSTTYLGVEISKDLLVSSWSRYLGLVSTQLLTKQTNLSAF